MKDTTKPLAVYVLNLFDCAVTLWFFSLFGISIESNPFGVALLQNPIITVLFKVVVIGLALLVLYFCLSLCKSEVLNTLFTISLAKPFSDNVFQNLTAYEADHYHRIGYLKFLV